MGVIMNDYNYPSNTAQSSSHFTNSTSILPWQHSIGDRCTSSNVAWKESIRNLGKLLWEYAGKLITLGLVTQVTVAQVSGTHVTQQNSRQDTVIFENKDYNNNTEIFVQYIKPELKQKILHQLYQNNDHLHALIEMFDADKNDESLESKSSQMVLSRLIRSSIQISQRQECTVPEDKLVELKNMVHQNLSNFNNCTYELNTDNWDELIKSITCIINSQNELIRIGTDKNLHDLKIKYTKALKDMNRTSSQKYQEKIENVLTKIQESVLLIRKLEQLLFTNILFQFSSLEISDGRIEQAVNKFKELPDNSTLSDIIKLSYNGKLDNFENIVNFVTNLPNCKQEQTAYLALFEIMKLNDHLNRPEILMFSKAFSKSFSKSLSFNNCHYFNHSLANELRKSVTILLNTWAYKIRNNNYQQILEFAYKYGDTLNSYLHDLTIKAYADDLENVRSILKFNTDLSNTTNCGVVVPSLFERMKYNNELDSSQLLMLAYNLKNSMELCNHTEGYNKYITLKNNLPSAIRRLIWNGFNCTIKNTYHKEYLQAASTTFQIYEKRRTVFTWRRGNVDSDCYWIFTTRHHGDSFTIQNIHYDNEYLYAAADDLAHDSKRRSVFTWIPEKYAFSESFWKITPTNNGKSFTIQNKHYNNELLYAAGDCLAYDKDRRRVFTCIEGDEVYQGIWEINC